MVRLARFSWILVLCASGAFAADPDDAWHSLTESVAAGKGSSSSAERNKRHHDTIVATLGHDVTVKFDWGSFKSAQWLNTREGFGNPAHEETLVDYCTEDVLESLARMGEDADGAEYREALRKITTVVCHHKPCDQLPRAFQPAGRRPEGGPGYEYLLSADGTTIDKSMCPGVSTWTSWKEGIHAEKFLQQALTLTRDGKTLLAKEWRWRRKTEERANSTEKKKTPESENGIARQDKLAHARGKDYGPAIAVRFDWDTFSMADWAHGRDQSHHDQMVEWYCTGILDQLVSLGESSPALRPKLDALTTLSCHGSRDCDSLPRSSPPAYGNFPGYVYTLADGGKTLEATFCDRSELTDRPGGANLLGFFSGAKAGPDKPPPAGPPATKKKGKRK